MTSYALNLYFFEKVVNMNIKETFGQRVRELRNQLGISQEKFALKIDMDRTYFASVESGKRNISIENIYKISNGLEVSLEELFKGL